MKDDSDHDKQPAISTHKTSIHKEAVVELLSGIYPEGITYVEFIAGGEGSQAFSFKKSGEEFVIRINRHGDSAFHKDQQAYKRFASDVLPIPEILNIGQMQNGYYFAISPKVPDVLVKGLSTSEIAHIAPAMFRVLDVLHEVDISTTSGYGRWDSSANAPSATWKEFLQGVNAFTIATATQPSLFDTSFLEKDVWDMLYARLVELTQHCPEERYLVHGDFGSDNLFVAEGEVSGVIDWGQSLYGDFLYDIAWLTFWSKGYDFASSYKAYAQSKGRDIHFFEERLLCYQLYIGLGSLSFYAYSNQKGTYEEVKKRLLTLI